MNHLRIVLSPILASKSHTVKSSFQPTMRYFHTRSVSMLQSTKPALADKEKVEIVFVDQDGNKKLIKANAGESLLEVAHKNEIELEGACEGSLACSTCHVYLSQAHYDMLEPPNDEENDMLDLAFALTDRSRLGCQVKVTAELAGMEVTIPPATRNMAVDGYVPKPH
eukprot:TRINITY_DN8114_c0_g1_i6.p1 TRINITY_DN8114_c0_g1~~TRINITY_DN8114_c0_g1_i6.p1  ORF type:complete len:167 (+),score=34.70 TRINITY_DN8114_c0_g1_i6:46-546(+)